MTGRTGNRVWLRIIKVLEALEEEEPDSMKAGQPPMIELHTDVSLVITEISGLRQDLHEYFAPPLVKVIENAEIPAVLRDWKRSALRQALGLFLASSFFFIIIESSPYLFSRLSLHEIWAEMTASGFTTGLDDATGSAIVTAAITLIGAITVAVILAPRIVDEANTFDSIALLKWTSSASDVAVWVASLSVAVSAAELASSTAVGLSLLSLAILGALLAAVTMRRSQDLHDANIEAVEIKEAEAALAKLEQLPGFSVCLLYT